MTKEYQHGNILGRKGQGYFTLYYYNSFNHLGAEEENTVGPEHSCEEEGKVETEVNEEVDKAEDDRNEKEDTWTNQKVRGKSEGNLQLKLTSLPILTNTAKHLLDNFVEKPQVDFLPVKRRFLLYF